MAEDNKSGKISFLQYLNTAILSIIAIISTIIILVLGDVSKNHQEFSKEMVRLKTVQDINTVNIKEVTNKVSNLELNYVDLLKQWVENNYVRKPQR